MLRFFSMNAHLDPQEISKINNAQLMKTTQLNVKQHSTYGAQEKPPYGIPLERKTWMFYLFRGIRKRNMKGIFQMTESFQIKWKEVNIKPVLTIKYKLKTTRIIYLLLIDLSIRNITVGETIAQSCLDSHMDYREPSTWLVFSKYLD